MSTETKPRKPRKSTKKLATDLANVQERVRGLATLPSERIEVAVSASGKAANFRTHDDRQRRVMRGLHVEIGSISGPVVWVPDAAAREALRALPRGDALAFASWLASFTGQVRLVDGHLRRELRDGQPMQVQVTDLDGAEAAKALATFDAVSDLAGTDAEALAALLVEIGKPAEQGTEELLQQLRAALPTAVRPVDDDEEEPVIPTDALVKKWQTAPGQLWVVPSLTVPGREHRLLCGDCRDPANVALLHEGTRPDLGLHDPPYGIDIVARAVSDAAGKKVGFKPHGGPISDVSAVRLKFAGGGIGDGARHGRAIVARGKFAPIEGDRGPFDPSHLLDAAVGVVLWGANHYADKLPPSPGVIVWDKRAESTGTNDFSDGELAWVSPKTSGRLRIIRHLWSGLMRASERTEKRLHPTQKPIAVQRQIVEWYTEPGDLVADWYMGAGAVIIACEQTGRIGHGMDIAHAYLAATLERLAARGLTPRLVVG